LNKNVFFYDDPSSEIVNDVFCDFLIEIGNTVFVLVGDLLKWIGNVAVGDDLLNESGV
jgi:hypothetical protein